jgi:putative redox protein
MQIITASIGTDPYQTTLSNSRQTLMADEAVAVNGKDLGPNPREILMMSLASCTAITLRMYADRKQWDITAIKVFVGFDKQETTTVFNCSIEVTGTIDDDQKSRLSAIAKACPVHKVLTQPIEININLL